MILSTLIASAWLLLPTALVLAATLNGRASSYPTMPLLQQEDTTEFWIDAAKAFVDRQALRNQNKNIAKNIILFMGDGMSMSTLAATRPYIGGEEMSLSFEEFPSVGMAKTYCVDGQTADSSCAAAAVLNGAKANVGTVGVTAAVRTNDCLANRNEDGHLRSIARWAMDAGKVAGLVTTSRVTSAVTAGLYGHSGSCHWENDVDVRSGQCDPDVTVDLARQMIENEVRKSDVDWF